MLRRFITLVSVAMLSAIVGVGMGILIAPASGENTREHLSLFIDEHSELFNTTIDRGREAFNQAYEFVTSHVSTTTNTS